jgi:hypothetical protein
MLQDALPGHGLCASGRAASLGRKQRFPSPTEGNPSSTEGIPSWAEGNPSQSEGIPSWAEGNPSQSEGFPSPAEGNPNVCPSVKASPFSGLRRRRPGGSYRKNENTPLIQIRSGISAGPAIRKPRVVLFGKEMSVSRNKARESRRPLGKALFPSGSSVVHAASFVVNLICPVSPAM